MIFSLQHLKVKPVEENKAFMTFVIPHDKENLLTVSIIERITTYHGTKCK